MKNTHIRNFSIIAHIDHGKSTLADRMLEATGTVENRRMREQVLDVMELERERGITIKMQPVRMRYKKGGDEYHINLIDTPGHIDFSYEVSRALTAVEGSILLVDATQGVQAQTLTTLESAKELGLSIVPVLSKIDSPLARVEEVREEVAELIGCSKEKILLVSGKTGEGVKELLDELIERIPPPQAGNGTHFRGLVFDFEYSTHQGIIVYIRVFDGGLKKREPLQFLAAKNRFNALEVGIFSPDRKESKELSAGEIGYIVTGIKESGIVSVGDTVVSSSTALKALPGYRKPLPVVFASVFPENQDDFRELRLALERLRLSDSSISFEEEGSGSLGRGFRCGFLGMLHLEIIVERLRREFNLSLVVTTPSVTYEIEKQNGKREHIYTPSQFPEDGLVKTIREPWVELTLISPGKYIGSVLGLLQEHEAEVGDSESFGDGRTKLKANMPLRELMRGFFDQLKSATSGFASLSYEMAGDREAKVARIDVLIAEELVPAFSKVVAKRRVEEEAREMVARLHTLLPRQLFVTKIQTKALGRIIASKTLPAMRKDVTGALYGGDVTRKRKLLEKQKKGKKRLAQRRGSVQIPQEVFLKMVRDT